MNRLPLCVLGPGSIGLRHAQAAAASDRIELTALVEPDGARRAALADQGYPVVAAPDAVPACTRAVVIATPTPDHRDSTLDCLSRGWGVLVEKPLAATLDEARACIAAARAAGLPLLTGHHRRCHPFAQAARDALTELGDLVGVQGLWSLRKHAAYFDASWRRAPGAGPLLTNLSHEIDLLHFLVGEITEVSALLSADRRGLAIEDTAALAFRFANGALGSFLISDAGASPWSFEAASGENPAIAVSNQDYLRVTGTEGALEFPSLTRWHRSGPGEAEWSKPLTRRPGPTFATVDPLREQIDRFAAVMAGATDDVLCSGTEGMAALQVTLAAALSGKQGRPVAATDVPGAFIGT